MAEHFKEHEEINFPAELRIESMAAGGNSIGHFKGMAVFVPGGAPGDLIEVDEIKRTGNYIIGRIVRIIEKSPLRQKPPCQYYPYCGGCQWQHLKYETQLKAKEEILRDAITRIGHFSGFNPGQIVPSPNEFNYRHRVQLKVLTSAGKMRWGFYASTSHYLVDIKNCLIAHPAINSLIRDLGNFIPAMKINPSRLGCVEINVDGSGKRVLCVLHPRRRRFEIPAHGRHILYRTPDGEELEVSLINSSLVKKMPIRTGDFTYQAGGTNLSAGAGVFSQTNLALNLQLVNKVLDFADPTPLDTVADIYSGVGNYAIPLAKLAARVEAVENNRRACLYGRENARINNLGNIKFHPRTAVEALSQLSGPIKTIIINPPRVGAGDIMNDISTLAPERVVYVSCNPATLSRDMAILAKSGYHLEQLVPFDMFPQTHHLETVALMVKTA